jgi:hypothetical protein
VLRCTFHCFPPPPPLPSLDSPRFRGLEDATLRAITSGKLVFVLSLSLSLSLSLVYLSPRGILVISKSIDTAETWLALDRRVLTRDNESNPARRTWSGSKRISFINSVTEKLSFAMLLAFLLACTVAARPPFFPCR